MPGLPDVSASPILAPLDSLNPEESTVAKKKTAKPKQTKTPEPAAVPLPLGTQPNAITIRGSAKWKEWLEGFAKHLRSKPTQVIDRSLAKLAELEKYKEPPDRMGT